MRGAGTQERALVGVHRRSPPEDPTGRTTGNQTLLGGRGQLNDTDGEEAKEKKERKRANCREKEPGRIWERGEKGGEGGPEPPSDGKSSKLNFKGQSLEISQAAVRGMEQHHPIMDKLGDHGGRTYRQTDRHVTNHC